MELNLFVQLFFCALHNLSIKDTNEKATLNQNCGTYRGKRQNATQSQSWLN